jgi:tetratricopeptide (TPR) repeat protein
VEDGLTDELARAITELCDRGDDDIENGRLDDAIAKYKDALGMLPEPRLAWRASTWILTALGEAHLAKGDPASAREALFEAVRSESGSGNALVHLRLGQAELGIGEPGKAKDELYRAFERGGLAIFEGEDPALFALIEPLLPDDAR